MRLIAVLCCGLTLVACERYTEKTSPCFNTSGTPNIGTTTRSTTNTPALELPVTKDCLFEPLLSQ